jgi:transcriptional regulator GlxA family with amidase domain
MDIVCFVFDGITALDIVGPFEVLQRLPDARVRFVAKRAGVVRTDAVATEGGAQGAGNLGLVADHGFADVLAADLLVVPGGFGTRTLEKDDATLDWIRTIDARSTWTTSVCTGSLLLAAAGLLRGKEATTHWASLERLRGYGAVPTARRVVEQGKYVTAAGVSSGIDMALTLVGRIAGADFARTVQLQIEYDPQPPFDAGSVSKAPPAIVAALSKRYAGT